MKRTRSPYSTLRSRSVRVLTALLGSLSMGCQGASVSGAASRDPVGPGPWEVLNAAAPDPRLIGTWTNPARGHALVFSARGTQVFHVLDEFCMADTGVVPQHKLFRIGEDRDEIHLAYYDYRDRPELLQHPIVFRRADERPACATPGLREPCIPPGAIFDLIWRSFDHFYIGFEARGIDWGALRSEYEHRATEARDADELFDVLAEMLAELRDGHVSVTLADRTANAGRPRLRERLRTAWGAEGTGITESAFVSAWHQGVRTSVYEVLDPTSLRSAAAGALEWGTIGTDVGYLRINRFSGFSDEPIPREQQIELLDAAVAAAIGDLDQTGFLVLDVALNGGGNDAAAMTVASHFADRTREAVIYDYAHEGPRVTRLTPADSVYQRPVLLLTSEVTASAAEVFVLAIRSLPHVTHVGERTRGGISSLLPKPFPGGFLVTISYERVRDANGREFEGVGIPPDVPITLFPDSDLHGGLATALRELAARPPR